MIVRRMLEGERPWMVEELTRRWGDRVVVARGDVIDVDGLDAFVADDDEGDRVGLLGFRIDRESLEVVTINAFSPGTGIGSALLEAAIGLARSASLRRLWLITTNSNVDAIAFYLKRGLSIAGVHSNAVSWSRVVKPAIPERDDNGIPIVDELELEMLFDVAGPPERNTSS